MGIHNFDHQLALQKNILRDAKITDKNKKLIADFVNDAILKGLSKPRLVKYFIIMRFVAEKLQKDLDTATVEDLKLIVGEIQQREDYSPWTKQMYKVIIRCFYRWKAGTKTYPPLVDWISIRISRCETHLPSEGELLTENDLKCVPRPHYKNFDFVLRICKAKNPQKKLNEYISI